MDFDGENPLHAIDIPVANLIVVEVEGLPILEKESFNFYDALLKAWHYIQLGWYMLLLIGTLAGFILLLVWLYNPCTFGSANNNDNL